MNISELITKLKKAEKKLGDVPVIVIDTHSNVFNIDETLRLFKFGEKAVALRPK